MIFVWKFYMSKKKMIGKTFIEKLLLENKENKSWEKCILTLELRGHI